MTIDDLREMKKESGYSNEQIAALSGLPLNEVEAAFAEIVDSINFDTLMGILRVFCQKDNLIKESTVPYRAKRDGEYTVEDYRAIPDECRVELIDGSFFTMYAPTTIHQMFITAILRVMDAYIRKNKGKCIAMAAPVDVQLDENNETMMQPDVLVLCDRDRIRRWGIWGAPDLVVEITSPSSRWHDSVRKYNKYRDAGVREYWIVDQEKKRVLVYDFEHGEEPTIYEFDAKVPVRIFGGQCQVDFAEIYEEVRFLYERE